MPPFSDVALQMPYFAWTWMPAIPTPSKRPFLVIPGIGFPIPLHRHCPLTSITYTIPHPLFPITITYHIPPSLHDIVTNPFPFSSLRSQHVISTVVPISSSPVRNFNPTGNRTTLRPSTAASRRKSSIKAACNTTPSKDCNSSPPQPQSQRAKPPAIALVNTTRDCTTLCPSEAALVSTLAVPRRKSNIKTACNTTPSRACDRCPPQPPSQPAKSRTMVAAITPAQPSCSATSAVPATSVPKLAAGLPVSPPTPSPFPDVQRADYHVCLGPPGTPHRGQWFAARRKLTHSTCEPQALWNTLDHDEQAAIVHHIPFISPPHAQPELQILHNSNPLSPFMRAFLIQLRDTAMIVPRTMPVNPPHSWLSPSPPPSSPPPCRSPCPVDEQQTPDEPTIPSSPRTPPVTAAVVDRATPPPTTKMALDHGAAAVFLFPPPLSRSRQGARRSGGQARAERLDRGVRGGASISVPPLPPNPHSPTPASAPPPPPPPSLPPSST